MLSATVIVAAHDEEAVIARTLRSLLAEAVPGEFDVVVVANGCSDDTAGVVRRGFPGVRVIELAEGSKVLALNAGLDAVGPGALLMLDADVVLSTRAARSLLATAAEPGVDAAIARMEIAEAGLAPPVRAFYRVWLQHPYFDGGKFAAAYALSPSGRARLGRFPRVTADDEYAARRMACVRTAPGACFTVSPPRTLAALLAVRTRSRRGTDELVAPSPRPVAADALRFAGRLVRRPVLWPGACLYLAVNLAARLRATRPAPVRWERDATSRTGAS